LWVRGGGPSRPYDFTMEKTEFVPDNVSENDVKDEANKRASQMGYCSKEGNPMRRAKISVGWSKSYADNFERIKKNG